MTFDSAFERRIAPTMESLGFIPSKDYYRQGGIPQAFHDKEGARFSARADWYHPRLGLFVETKSGTLNSKTTVRTAASAEASQHQRRRLRGETFSTYDMLQTQWCHSRFKQAAVQRALTPQNMVVVFDKPPSWADAWDYWKAGIVFVPLSDLRQYIAALQLQRLGIGASFSLGYNVEGQEVSFVL